MRQDASVELFQYWNRLRDGRPAPKRTEVEPADIKALLADTFILERDSRGEAVFRLAGTRLCAAYGRELKGFSFSSLWRQRDQRILRRLLDGIFTDNSVVVVSYEGISSGNRALAFELVVLPLDSNGDNARCLGLITACDRAYWLGVDAIIDANITSMRVFDPSQEPLFLKTRPAVDVPHEASETVLLEPGTGSLTMARRIRHLLVLDGGKRGPNT